MLCIFIEMLFTLMLAVSGANKWYHVPTQKGTDTEGTDSGFYAEINLSAEMPKERLEFL